MAKPTVSAGCFRSKTLIPQTYIETLERAVAMLVIRDAKFRALLEL